MQLLKVGVNKIIHNIFKRSNPLLAELIVNWPKIAGEKISSHSSPLKIISSKEKGKKHNCLIIEVVNSSYAMELSFQQDIMIERIAVYLGYKGIHKIRVLVNNYKI